LQAPQAATVPAPIAPARTTPANESARSAAEPKELPSSDVRYLYQPKLVYPRASQEMGETGVVKVRVLVDEEGHPRTVQVVKSSGFPRLDRQAIQTMNATRFQPHMEGGVPRAVWVSTEVTFQLD
jgi:protein TonB